MQLKGGGNQSRRIAKAKSPAGATQDREGTMGEGSGVKDSRGEGATKIRNKGAK